MIDLIPALPLTCWVTLGQFLQCQPLKGGWSQYGPVLSLCVGRLVTLPFLLLWAVPGSARRVAGSQWASLINGRQAWAAK